MFTNHRLNKNNHASIETDKFGEGETDQQCADMCTRLHTLIQYSGGDGKCRVRKTSSRTPTCVCRGHGEQGHERRAQRDRQVRAPLQPAAVNAEKDRCKVNHRRGTFALMDRVLSQRDPTSPCCRTASLLKRKKEKSKQKQTNKQKSPRTAYNL